MANSVAYLGYSHAASGSQDFVFKYQITFSGSYVTTTGESVNLLAASNTNGLELNGFVPMGTSAELDVTANIGGYSVVTSNYSAGTFQVNIFGGTTELTSEAYPAGISGGSVTVAIPHRG